MNFSLKGLADKWANPEPRTNFSRHKSEPLSTDKISRLLDSVAENQNTNTTAEKEETK